MNKPYHTESYWDEVAEQISSRKDLKIIAGDDEPYYRYKRERFLETDLFVKSNLPNNNRLPIDCQPF